MIRTGTARQMRLRVLRFTSLRSCHALLSLRMPASASLERRGVPNAVTSVSKLRSSVLESERRGEGSVSLSPSCAD
jgi:hypothetical protein